jgi:DNA-binding transcriptional LysR family regulator
MDVHLRDLRYFVAVVDELSLTRAAERVHLSQPALSKQVRGLETTLRARLLRRDRRQVSLTAAGVALHAAARGLPATPPSCGCRPATATSPARFSPRGRFVALSTRHPLAGRQAADFSEIIGEPFAALPTSAGPLRDFWLASDHRAGQSPHVATEVTTADEVFERVTSGAAVTLLAEGNAIIYSRPGITCISVTGLDPARLAIAWRHGDRRAAVRDFIHACGDAAGTRTHR